MDFQSFDNLKENLEEIRLLADSAEKALATHSTDRGVGNAMTRAGLVLLCGLLEGFLRELAEEFIESINENKINLNSLPDQVFCTTIEKITELYRRKQENIKELINPQKISNLDKKIFSKTGGNPSVNNIENIFNGLGIPNIIDKLTIQDYKVDTTFLKESQIDTNMREKLKSVISQHAHEGRDVILQEITKIIDKKWNPKTRRRKVGYINEIESLLTKRNRIAHGEGEVQITPQELLDALDMVLRLSNGISRLASDLLEDLIVAK